MLLAVVMACVLALPAHAGTLSGIYHNPYGTDDLYSQDPCERQPHDPEVGQDVWLHATTWPISPGQSTWVTWSLNGVEQTPKGFDWDYNSGNNTYWKLNIGSFNKGDVVTYTIHADVDGGNQIDAESYSFRVAGQEYAQTVESTVASETYLDLKLTNNSASIRFTFPESDQVHIQVAPHDQPLTIADGSTYKSTDTGDTIVLSTDALSVVINKNPYHVQLLDKTGHVITQHNGDGGKTSTHWGYDGADVQSVSDSWTAAPDERIEGFGERYNQLNQLGKTVTNYVYNQYRDQGTAERTYLSAPFYRSSAGYGLYVNSTATTVFDVSNAGQNAVSFRTETQDAHSLDYYLFTGTPERILDNYTSVVGRPKLPPKWAFGVWMSANEWNTQAEVENELANAQQYAIPHTAMVLEQWSDEATFYTWHGAQYQPKSGSDAPSYDDFTFPADGEWTDPKAMVDTVHDHGMKLVLWQIPVLKQNFDTNPSTAPQQHVNDREYAVSQGYVVKNSDGTPYRIPEKQWFGNSMVPDFTNPSATRWWMNKRAYLVDELGIDGFKTDGGEVIFGRNTRFSDGSNGMTMHNGYPQAYTSAYSSFLQNTRGNDATLFSRAGNQHAQTTGIYWAGDQNSNFTGMNEALTAGLSAGQSGIPFWSWDLAGFTGEFPSSELYLRATAMSTFMPIMQYHSEKSNPTVSETRTPWNVQERTGDANVIPTFRKYANIRMSLMPYIYTAANQATNSGTPLMRTMQFAFPDDGQAAGNDRQYMFGPNLLVAPITDQGATTKNLYLPEGEWFDLWNGGAAQGNQWKQYYADVSSIPVYAKAGSIIPLNLPDTYQLGDAMTNELTNHNLTFRIYPSGDSSSDYFDDVAGQTVSIAASEDFSRQRLNVDIPALSEDSTLQVYSGKPQTVIDGDEPMRQVASLEELHNTGQAWFYDDNSQFTYVKVNTSNGPHHVSFQGITKAAYEAEFADTQGTGTNTDHPGYTGTGFVDQFAEQGDAVTFSVHTPNDGNYDLNIRYSNGSGTTATRTLYIDGQRTATIQFPATSDWNTWDVAKLNVPLQKGTHKITIQYDQTDSRGINVDHLAVTVR